MKNNKAAGEDGIVAEFLKALPQGWVGTLTEILRGILNQGIMIEGWEVARVFPIYKAGDENVAENYRGVSLLDVGYKLLTSVMAKRIRKWAENEGKFKESQAEFREKRGTRDHVFVLKSLVGNKLKRKRGKLYAAFIDFKTAFDKVNREIMMKKLEGIGVKVKMLRMIGKIYEETKSEIITPDGVTGKFVTWKGVRQGCPLSSTIFNICLDDIDDMWERRNEGGYGYWESKDILFKVCGRCGSGC